MFSGHKTWASLAAITIIAGFSTYVIFNTPYYQLFTVHQALKQGNKKPLLDLIDRPQVIKSLNAYFNQIDKEKSPQEKSFLSQLSTGFMVLFLPRNVDQIINTYADLQGHKANELVLIPPGSEALVNPVFGKIDFRRVAIKPVGFYFSGQYEIWVGLPGQQLILSLGKTSHRWQIYRARLRTQE